VPESSRGGPNLTSVSAIAAANAAQARAHSFGEFETVGLVPRADDQKIAHLKVGFFI
jgi:hypothetical protein